MLKLDVKFTKITFTLFALSWFVGDYTGNWHDDYKYLLWILSLVLGLMPLIYYAVGYKKDSKKIKWDTYTFKYVTLVVVVFALVSICAIPFNGHHLFMWKDLFYIFMPGLYILAIVNLDDSDNFDYYIDLIFWGFVANFILIAKPSSFTLSNFLSISFADSYSPWESGLADVYIVCFVYYYARKKKLHYIIAAILNILSFKRLNLVFMAIYILIERLLKDKPVSKAVELLAKAALIISPLLIYAAMSDSFAAWFENQFGMDLNGFTMGRFNQLNQICDLDANMTGLGMTHYMLIKIDFDIHRLHCDIMRILIETTVVGLVVFVNSYINIAKRNQQGFALMVFFLIVMVSSTCIENTLYWLLIFLVIESFQRIAKRREERENGECPANR